MFSYFGAKSKILNHYPPPEHDLIIEPFAGSARYACKWGLDRDVWLNDKYIVIYKIWKWIINATKYDIDNLPVIKKGDDLRNIKCLSDVERSLLGFAVGRGRNNPGNILTGWADKSGRNEITELKIRLRTIVGRIGHWKVTCLEYLKCKSENNATYFVDPPYQHRKCDYEVTNTDPNFYRNTRAFCRGLNGQVIVCESHGADWLPFKPLITYGGQQGISQEVIWTNRPDYVPDRSPIDIGDSLL